MSKLSIVIAYVNEFPQLIFTIRSIVEELRGVDFEIIAVNNYCEEVRNQNRPEDQGTSNLIASMEGNDWLRVLHYEEKLSHWQAKNLGIKEAKGDFLWLPDAHVFPSRGSLSGMFDYYQREYKSLNGSMHMNITYQILENTRLIYHPVIDVEKGKFSYQFGDARNLEYPYEVPCMSTCGVLMHRDVIESIGGWPKEIGIYGGGEPFFNFTLAVLGMKKWIWPFGALHHHGAPRGYHWNYDGWLRDECIAAYMFGGEKLSRTTMSNCDGIPQVKERILDSIFMNESCKEHRRMIEEKQIISIEDWWQIWKK